MRRNARALILSEEFRRLKAENTGLTWENSFANGLFPILWECSVTKTGLHPMKIISIMIRADNWLR